MFKIAMPAAKVDIFWCNQDLKNRFENGGLYCSTIYLRTFAAFSGQEIY
jgi:hypothetical protein